VATASATPFAAPDSRPASAPASAGRPADDRPARDDRGSRDRRPRRGPAPLRNDSAPTEKEFWEVWSEERGEAGGPPPPGAPTDAPAGESAGPVIAPPRARGPEELLPGTARLYLNLGRKDGASEREVLDLLSAHVTLASPPELDIMNTHTYINVRAEDAAGVCDALTGKELAGRALLCEPAKPRRR
jgi:hypothetical protein